MRGYFTHYNPHTKERHISMCYDRLTRRASLERVSFEPVPAPALRAVLAVAANIDDEGVFCCERKL